MVYQQLPFLGNKKIADISWTQRATSSFVGNKHRYIYTKFNVVILLYYHIKTVSLRSDSWKSTKAKKRKAFAKLKKYTLSQWFYSFEYKVIYSTDSDSYRSKLTLFSVSRRTLWTHSLQKVMKETPRFCTGKLGKPVTWKHCTHDRGNLGRDWVRKQLLGPWAGRCGR